MRGDRVDRASGERGAVLVAVLCALMGLSAVAMSVALLATVETRIARVTEARTQVQVTAAAAIEAAFAELALEPDWDAVLSGRRVSTLLAEDRPSGPGPIVPGWGPLDLGLLTNRLQRRTEARSVWAADTGGWQLYLQGVPWQLISGDFISGELVLGEPPRTVTYAGVWVADDEADGDGRPEQDANGLVVVRAEAFGSGRAHAVVVATVRRRSAAGLPGGGVELISWRSPIA
jgi:hypothetical protein